MREPRRFRPGYVAGFLLIGLFGQFDVIAPLAFGSVALGHRLAFRAAAGPVELWAVNQGGFFSMGSGPGALLLALLIALMAAFRPARQTGLRPR